ncbi:MAG: hypothetical protein IKS66_00195 [Oscillospiraceae bacterium]|nr:hypothetical protein [Oscillospiraceae bacterium]
MTCLVTFSPLEPYTFGTDQSFVFEDAESVRTGKESYLAASNLLPEQTMLLGTLRYMALQKAGLLHTDLCYEPEEQEAIRELIGPESFSFQKPELSFGVIRSLSPLFLVNRERQTVLIPNPFHNTAQETGYVPMQLGPALCTSAGSVRLPPKEAYNAKDGYGSGFLELGSRDADRLQIYRKLFRKDLITGNQKVTDDEEREKAFFRRERYVLEKDYAFAVLAETADDALHTDCVVYMGVKRAAFLARVCPVTAFQAFQRHSAESPSDLLKNLVEAELDTGETWYYALSDLILHSQTAQAVADGSVAAELDDLIPPPGFRLGSFAIVEEKSLRNIETKLGENRLLNRRRRSSIRWHLIRAGSVFSKQPPALEGNAAAEAIGYNVICNLGGKKP